MRVLSILATVFFVGVFGVNVFCLAACKKPNPSTAGCIEPGDRVADCKTVGTNVCASAAQYAINLFPDGEVDDCAGNTYTTEVSSDCYKKAQCEVNDNVTPPSCENMDGYGSWFLGNKKVTDPASTCTEVCTS